MISVLFLIRFFSAKLFLPFLILLILFGCEKRNKVNIDNIVAIIASDTIYTNDLITRAEFNVRPNYCDSKTDYDKHIVLNSIIAEKLFALEGVSNQNSINDDEMFNATLKGIKEQAMREELLYYEVNSKVIVPQEEVRQSYINSKKTIEAVAIFIPSGIDADLIYKDAKNGITFDELSKKYIGISEPGKKIITSKTVDKTAYKAIFSPTVTKGRVLKPIEAVDGKRLIKVISWTEEVELSPGTVNKQMEMVRGELERDYITQGTTKYIANIMSGKELKFNPESWDYIVNYLKPIYVSEQKDKQFDIELDNLYKELNLHTNMPFIYDGDNVLSINDFINAVKMHPLEINRKDITNENFGFRLRSAIAALVIDDYLTKIAYSRNYDKLNVVNRTVNSWKTHFNFMFQRDSVLVSRDFKGNIQKDYFDAFDNYLTPYFDSLKTKYDSKIKVNRIALDKIKLTSVQMFTRKSRGPYLNVTPPFPVVTNSAKINYKLIEETEQK